MTLTRKVPLLSNLCKRQVGKMYRDIGWTLTAHLLAEQQGGCGIGVSHLSPLKACLKTSESHLFKKTPPSPDSTFLQAKPLTQWATEKLF